MHGLTREAKNKLLKYNWPGNVRELQHTIERAVILGDGSLLKPENFLFHSSVRQKKEEEVLNLEQLERQAVDKAMRLSEGNITRAAEYLGITHFDLYRKMSKSLGNTILPDKVIKQFGADILRLWVASVD